MPSSVPRSSLHVGRGLGDERKQWFLGMAVERAGLPHDLGAAPPPPRANRAKTRCAFAHGAEELRRPTIPKKGPPTPKGAGAARGLRPAARSQLGGDSSSSGSLDEVVSQAGVWRKRSRIECGRSGVRVLQRGTLLQPNLARSAKTQLRRKAPRSFSREPNCAARGVRGRVQSIGLDDCQRCTLRVILAWAHCLGFGRSRPHLGRNHSEWGSGFRPIRQLVFCV